MKNFSILLAMLFLAFSVEAQNAGISKRSKDRKSSKTKVTQLPSSSKTRNSKSLSLVKRSSSNRNTKYSSDSPVSRRRDSRDTRISSSSRATKSYTNTSGWDGRRSSSSRTVRPESTNRSSRSTSVSSTRKNRSTSSVARRNSISKGFRAASRRVYTSKNHRVKRYASTLAHSYPSLEYRRVHNPYRKPLLSALYWDARMYRNYRLWYPDFNFGYYPYGYRIHTISAYDSYRYIGEVSRIYGRVSEVWYSRETREYYLYFGGSFPYHDFTVILNAQDAKRYSWNPVGFFTNRRLLVTGLLSVFDEKPELLIQKRSQIRLY